MLPDSCATPPVRIEVVDVLESGVAPCGYEKGDTWFMRSDEVPDGLCVWALVAMAPMLVALRFGGGIPWEGNGSVGRVCCSDPSNPVVFELRRLEEADPR
jgi:uncharacterized repeat protein (TIGR04076 family)